MAKDTFYFSHDYNSRNDEKVKRLIRKHGMLGYGVFWAIIEDLYNNANEMQTDYDGIAYEHRVDESLIKSVLCDFNLFVINGESFGSLSVQKRLEERNDKSAKARRSALKRWDKEANAKQAQSERIEDGCDSNAIKERKGKESKINIAFDVFWNLYDKKSSREKCEKKWNALKDKDRETIISTLPSYILATPDKKYRKNPETYFNNKSWEDEILNTTPKEKPRNLAGDLAPNDGKERLRYYFKTENGTYRVMTKNEADKWCDQWAISIHKTQNTQSIDFL